MIEEREVDVDMSVTVIEIHNKKIRDLLSKVHTHHLTAWGGMFTHYLTMTPG